ncbi:transcriptional regulator, AraC family [Variovorax sp. 770b2]|nr:transcriptional regulator, AraC family [Variovorax sp. 770b2]
MQRLLPEIEIEPSRLPAMGYELQEDVGPVTCLEHGFPTPLVRWHSHEEFELHLIVATSGTAFVGDWIGPFEPGHLVFCGARLPHNWISLDAPLAGVMLRDRVIQFLPEATLEAALKFPEMHEAARMLRRARHGIEFFGMGPMAERHWLKIKAARGLKRLWLLCEFLAELSQCATYRLLSNTRTEESGIDELHAIHELIARIANDPAMPLTAAGIAAQLGMSIGRFGRLFRRCTGCSFPGYLNQARVTRASYLLMESGEIVQVICRAAGFSNLANFNRQFLRIKGMTPTEFRRQSRLRLGSFEATSPTPPQDVDAQ